MISVIICDDHAVEQDQMEQSTKLTRNQQTVLDALARAGQPLSAYQILDDDVVRKSGIKAPLTVYRAVERLVANGLIHRIESLNAFVVCDHEPHKDPAAFMICNSCKQTIEVGTSDVQSTVDAKAAQHGFTIDTVQIEISGLCENCDE